MRSQTGNILTLHQTAGQFIQDEAITVDGIDNGRIITKVTEFSINDIHSIRQEVGVPFATETSGTMRTEKTNAGLTNPLNEASLVEIYGYNENDDFGFESFVYEGSNYDEEREREEIWNKHEKKEAV